MTFLIVKVFFFGFEDADRRNIVTEKDKVIEEQDVKDYKSELKDELSSDVEKV